MAECETSKGKSSGDQSESTSHQTKETEKEKGILSLTETRKVEQLFIGLSLAALSDTNNTQFKGNDKKATTPVLKDLENLSISDKMFCSFCDCEFLDRQQQTFHYKTDWHRYNLKRKLKGWQSLSLEVFEKMIGSDMSSISGSASSSEDGSSDDGIGREKVKVFSKKIIEKSVVTESEDDEESFHIEGLGRRHPRVFVRNSEGEMFSIYRCIIHGKKIQPSGSEDLISMVTDMPKRMKWAIFMTAAGHVAAAVFDKEKVVVHKTFHRYTVRAKRGTAQGLRDSQGNAPHSAGASLRRYNEAALNQEVSDLIKNWSEELKSCDRIFLRAPSFNRAMFFSGKNPPLDKKDPRIRMVPFPTRRPTFSELKRVHTILATIESYGKESSIHDYVQVSPKHPTVYKKSTAAKMVESIPGIPPINEESDGEPDNIQLIVSEESMCTSDLQAFECTKKPRKRKKKKPETPSGNTIHVQEEPPAVLPQKQFGEEEIKCRNTIFTACKLGDINSVKNLLQPLLPSNLEDQGESLVKPIEKESSGGDECSDNSVSLMSSNVSPILLSEPFSDARKTLLGVAAAQNHKEIVHLLLEAGADPTIRDLQNKPPYILASEKSTRNEFRKFMSKYPERYDYSAAQIPAPLTAEMESDRKAKESERKKAAKKAKKDRLQDKKAEETAARIEKQKAERFLKLSDREKRALAAEKRLAAQFTDHGQAVPVLVRCWQCGMDITGKVPFEYFDYKFCSPKCLKDHKKGNSGHSNS